MERNNNQKYFVSFINATTNIVVLLQHSSSNINRIKKW